MDPLAELGIPGLYVLVTTMLVALLTASADRFHAGPRPASNGEGSLAFEGRIPPPCLVAMPELPVDQAMQAAEVRQMLEAKSYRRQRRGEPPLDIEAEMAQVLDTSPASAPPDLEGMLRAEIRELVISRNERRLRRGKEPLDVEAETERQIAGFTGLAK